MKDIGHLARQYLLSCEAAKKVMCGFAAGGIIHAGESCDFLDHVFAELTALDQRRVCVFRKEALCQNSKPVELRANLFKMIKIRQQLLYPMPDPRLA